MEHIGKLCPINLRHRRILKELSQGKMWAIRCNKFRISKQPSNLSKLRSSRNLEKVGPQDFGALAMLLPCGDLTPHWLSLTTWNILIEDSRQNRATSVSIDLWWFRMSWGYNWCLCMSLLRSAPRLILTDFEYSACFMMQWPSDSQTRENAKLYRRWPRLQKAWCSPLLTPSDMVMVDNSWRFTDCNSII